MKTKINSYHKYYLPLFLIFILGFLIRLIGVRWDQGQHLHPDERFLTMVITSLKIPQNLSQYLNPKISPLNPYNQGYDFFVYGSFPVNLLRILGQIFNTSSYDQIYLIGRYLCIFLDSFIIILVFYIGSKIFNQKTGLIAAFLYSICVLPTQLSRFFTSDPFLNFFIILSFCFLVSLQNKKHQLPKIVLLSLSFGLALASKISAIYFAPIILLFFIFNYKKDFIGFIKNGFIFLILSVFIFRFFQPQVFTSANFLNWQPNSQFISNLKELKAWDKNPYFPPAIQWIKVVPLVFPLKNIFLWSLGPVLGSIFLISLVFNFKKFKTSSNKLILFLSLFWILFLFFVQGIQAVSTMRYFLPIYPFICVISSSLLAFIFKTKPVSKFIIIPLLFVYPVMFLSVFLKDHTRVQASKWIYQNISSGSVLATEYWDDALPLPINSLSPTLYQYQSIHIADMETDNPSKIENIKSQLAQSDYLIFSSNRFIKPIPQNSDIFPQTAKLYQSIFDGSLGFNQVAEFVSYPCFPPVGKSWFCLNDSNAEEAFTVYDHPQVVILKRDSRNSQ